MHRLNHKLLLCPARVYFAASLYHWKYLPCGKTNTVSHLHACTTLFQLIRPPQVPAPIVTSHTYTRKTAACSFYAAILILLQMPPATCRRSQYHNVCSSKGVRAQRPCCSRVSQRISGGHSLSACSGAGRVRQTSMNTFFRCEESHSALIFVAAP